MKIEELRIGNYVNYKPTNTIGQISTIMSPAPYKNEKFNEKQLVYVGFSAPILATIDEIEPIKLIKEILIGDLKFQIKKSGKWNYADEVYNYDVLQKIIKQKGKSLIPIQIYVTENEMFEYSYFFVTEYCILNKNLVQENFESIKIYYLHQLQNLSYFIKETEII